MTVNTNIETLTFENSCTRHDMVECQSIEADYSANRPYFVCLFSSLVPAWGSSFRLTVFSSSETHLMKIDELSVTRDKSADRTTS